MKKEWKDVKITDVSFAMYVAPSTGKASHKNRPYHGFVLNCPEAVRDYVFDNGEVMHTTGGSLFYLPYGSNYDVKMVASGGCYAINFEADISDTPFCITLRNSERVFHDFRLASNEWRKNGELRLPIAMRALYGAICAALKEGEREYLPSEKKKLILPVLERIDTSFAEDISMPSLAASIGISEVYMRRLFYSCVGMSPKEYIIKKRIDYAARLLSSGDFSVSEVARLCGYSEPCHFSREFTKRIGCAPARYRER